MDKKLGDVGACEICGAPGWVILDPFVLEICGEKELVILCKDHEQVRLDDI